MLSLSKEISKLIGELGLNIKFGSPIEAAFEFTQDLNNPLFVDMVFPACLVYRDIDKNFDGKDKRYTSKFDLKLILLTQTKPDYTTDERDEISFDNELYPLMDKIIKLIKRSPIIVCDHLITYKFKERYAINVANEMCDGLEITIDNLKLINK
jgi:hypothetical protein